MQQSVAKSILPDRPMFLASFCRCVGFPCCSTTGSPNAPGRLSPPSGATTSCRIATGKAGTRRKGPRGGLTGSTLQPILEVKLIVLSNIIPLKILYKRFQPRRSPPACDGGGGSRFALWRDAPSLRRAGRATETIVASRPVPGRCTVSSGAATRPRHAGTASKPARLPEYMEQRAIAGQVVFPRAPGSFRSSVAYLPPRAPDRPAVPLHPYRP